MIGSETCGSTMVFHRGRVVAHVWIGLIGLHRRSGPENAGACALKTTTTAAPARLPLSTEPMLQLTVVDIRRQSIEGPPIKLKRAVTRVTGAGSVKLTWDAGGAGRTVY